MEQIISKLKYKTNGEGFTDITNDLNLFIKENNFISGILNLTSLHTSCSLTINENADPNVLEDLKKLGIALTENLKKLGIALSENLKKLGIALEHNGITKELT